MNKKGSILDLPFYVIFIFIMAIVIIVAYMIISNFNTSLQATSLASEAKTLSSQFKDRFLNSFNWFMLTIVIVMIVAMLLSAFVLRSNPAIALVAVLVWIVVIGFSIHMSNAFNDFSTADGISTYVNEFTLMNPIMENMPQLVTLLGVLFIIVLYATTNRSGVQI